ncbi:MAG: aminoacyl--tRNA ligase-related protein [Patescibacteria group bacterium]
MRYSQVFPKTKKTAPKDAESINHQLLVRAGFIDQLMSGSWTFLPLGLRVLQKVVQIIREEMNATGAQELAMPLLHPKEIWNETGRWDTAKEVMYQFKDTRDKEYALSFTHEEIVIDLARKHIQSYKDLPLKIYQFSTKFRNEARARSGILRGREFLMKDLYSIHISEVDMYEYYWQVKEAYLRAFKRMGFESIKVAEASGGVFTDKHTHEFQVLADSGEDTIYYCDCGECEWVQNKEVFEGKVGEKCPECGKCEILESKSIEVGNIFPLDTRYSEKMNFFVTDENGNKINPWFASYGIGPSRVVGTLVETNHDNKGIIWPESVAPFLAHLVNIGVDASNIYTKLQDAGVDVLYDDRDLSAGEKFADADLIGIPVRLVVSKKTNGKIEWKMRNSKTEEVLDLEEVTNRLAPR